MLQWLIEGGIGPALVALPVNWAGETGARIAGMWFRRLRRADDLSRLVSAAAGATVDLNRAQFKAVRQLLEDERTWRLAGQGTVEDLIGLIASSLQDHADGLVQDARAAAACIARGLLEFGVADVEPAVFQRLLFARLGRMEARQATALDQAMLSLHADVAAWFSRAGGLDADRAGGLMGHLRLILDRLPPAPADRGEIAVYLSTLIGWLSSDPWPRDQRFGGSELDAVALECSLRVTVDHQGQRQVIDADSLAARSHRLVILGGPGSGKTWLARRTARRCAEDALEALVCGDSLEQVELPLYTTCSQLFNAAGDIRRAVVSSAFDLLADLGGSRLSAALRAFFEERNAPTLLVIDSLDEAAGPDDRLRQADTLPWRIFLSSRPSSWSQQLVIDRESGSEQVAELQTLNYPRDVESFIYRWFADDPDQGRELAAQIARRPGIQKAAVVPLVLTFYCLLGGDQLPRFRYELQRKVLTRMLAGRWRGRGPQPDVGSCLEILRTWAWAGESSDPVSGIGTWDDDVPTCYQDMSPPTREAVDHVAPAVGLPDLDTGIVLRRFVHRSIREHLVAEHVACLPVEQAVAALLPHLWHDPDWEQAAPAAIALHPERDGLLRDLLCHAAQSPQVPADLSMIDGGWQIRLLLARIAAESHARDWSPEMVRTIGRARAELAQARGTSDLAATPDWEASNRQIRRVLLQTMASDARSWEMPSLVDALTQFYPVTSDHRLAADALLQHLAKPEISILRCSDLLNPLAGLVLTAEDKLYVRRQLLIWAGGDTGRWYELSLARALLKLNPTAEDKSQIRSGLLAVLAQGAGNIGFDEHEWARRAVTPLREATDDPGGTRLTLLALMSKETSATRAIGLAHVLTQLDPAEDDRRQARAMLFGLLERQDAVYTAAALINEIQSLDPAQEEIGRARTTFLSVLEHLDRGYGASEAPHVLASLDPGPEDVRRACAALLAFLGGEGADRVDVQLLDALIQLNPTAQDLHVTLDSLLEQILDRVARIAFTPDEVEETGRCIAMLAPTAGEKRHALATLLRGLPGLANEELLGAAVADLAPVVADLACTAEGRENAREVMLGILASPYCSDFIPRLIEPLVQLAPEPWEKSQLRHELLKLMRDEANMASVATLASTIYQLDPSAQDTNSVLAAVITAIAGAEDDRSVCDLADTITLMASAIGDRYNARKVLLVRMAQVTDEWAFPRLVDSLQELGSTSEDTREARHLLLRLMTNESIRNRTWCTLAGGLEGLEPTSEDRRQARHLILQRMASGKDKSDPDDLAQILAQLDPTAQERRQACRILSGQAAEGFHLKWVIDKAIVKLRPTVEDISPWANWGDYLPLGVFAAARRNSPFTSWLAFIHGL